MKKRALFTASVFVFFIVVFLVLKSIFTITHSQMGGGLSTSDFFAVLYNGLGLDMSVSGYLAAIPALLTIVSLWIKPSLTHSILRVYFVFISVLLSLIFVTDLAIYPYWGFHFDSTIFLYLQNPKESMASASFGEMALGLVAFLVVGIVIYLGAKYLLLSQVKRFNTLAIRKTWKPCIVLILLTGALFLPIRGGVTASTMNVGNAYFSENMYLNHAAINPHFNLLYSMTKSEKFAKQYQFYEREKATQIFEELTHKSQDNAPSLLNTERPNVVLIMLESFSAGVAYDSVVAPNFTKFASEGVNFSNFYANSFRTDRGVVSILSGYPAHPTAALMKYPAKTQTLPAIPKTLVANGYSSSYYYGGDVDFASMRSYVVGACATKDIYDDKDFLEQSRFTKWGAADEFVLERIFEHIDEGKYPEPFIVTTLTLSSHEPFDVPMEKVLDDPFLNSVHYTDKCLGEFVDKMKQSRYWDNTLIVLLADHCMQSFPEGAASNDARRFHIPLVWTGGALKGSKEIKSYGSQNDLAATLLAQLGVDYSDYKFSNDILNHNEPKYAFYSYNNGFSMIDSTGTITYDNDAQKVLKQEGVDLEEKAKSFFQMMYLDLGER